MSCSCDNVIKFYIKDSQNKEYGVISITEKGYFLTIDTLSGRFKYIKIDDNIKYIDFNKTKTKIEG